VPRHHCAGNIGTDIVFAHVCVLSKRRAQDETDLDFIIEQLHLRGSHDRPERGAERAAGLGKDEIRASRRLLCLGRMLLIVEPLTHQACIRCHRGEERRGRQPYRATKRQALLGEPENLTGGGGIDVEWRHLDGVQGARGGRPLQAAPRNAFRAFKAHHEMCHIVPFSPVRNRDYIFRLYSLIVNCGKRSESAF